jgi:hypothetical protein
VCLVSFLPCTFEIVIWFGNCNECHHGKGDYI